MINFLAFLGYLILSLLGIIFVMVLMGIICALVRIFITYIKGDEDVRNR